MKTIDYTQLKIEQKRKKEASTALNIVLIITLAMVVKMICIVIIGE